MESYSSILLIIVGILCLVLFIKIAKAMIRLIAFAFIAGIAFYFWNGTQESKAEDQGLSSLLGQVTSLSQIQELCLDQAESIHCECLISLVKEDLDGRLTQRDLEKIDQDTRLVLAQIRQSLINQQDEISSCLKEKKNEVMQKKFEQVLEKAKRIAKN